MIIKTNNQHKSEQAKKIIRDREGPGLLLGQAGLVKLSFYIFLILPFS